MTSNPQNIEIAKGYQISFLQEPKQIKSPNPVNLTFKKESLLHLEILAILRKSVIQMVKQSQNQILSARFLAKKKD